MFVKKCEGIKMKENQERNKIMTNKALKNLC